MQSFLQAYSCLKCEIHNDYRQCFSIRFLGMLAHLIPCIYPLISNYIDFFTNIALAAYLMLVTSILNWLYWCTRLLMNQQQEIIGYHKYIPCQCQSFKLTRSPLQFLHTEVSYQYLSHDSSFLSLKGWQLIDIWLEVAPQGEHVHHGSNYGLHYCIIVMSTVMWVLTTQWFEILNQ